MAVPTVGLMVHYTSYGTPGGEYASQCRAAVVAGVLADERLELVVLNPTGLFFNECDHDEGASGGTWHWPERAEG